MTNGARLPALLKSRPILLLLLLTPGIPEYLSSSSPLNAIILNPPLFLLQVLANVGLYGSGALLIHDARVRWNKGWWTVILLGTAYGILEEGVALSTLFDPKAGPVGQLGYYGHWLGVNWVWAAGIVPFHALFSISIPLLLLGLALPETRTRALLSRRRTVAVLLILVADVIVLMAVVRLASGYWMGTPILISSLLAIGSLIWASRQAPTRFLRSRVRPRRPSSRKLALVGISFFPAVLLTEALGNGAGIPSITDFAILLFLQALYLVYVTRTDWTGNPRGELALALGLLVPIAVFGVLAELSLPLTLLADVCLYAFFRRLWSAYPQTNNDSMA
jgi:hypothetical protein